jgi:hypothetical protein
MSIANVEAEKEQQKRHPCPSQTEAPSCCFDDNISARRTLQIMLGYLRGSAVCCGPRTSQEKATTLNPDENPDIGIGIGDWRLAVIDKSRENGWKL